MLAMLLYLQWYTDLYFTAFHCFLFDDNILYISEVIALFTAVSAQDGPFWQQNITQDRELFLTQLKLMFW